MNDFAEVGNENFLVPQLKLYNFKVQDANSENFVTSPQINLFEILNFKFEQSELC
jgi:hypothetical protein